MDQSLHPDLLWETSNPGFQLADASAATAKKKSHIIKCEQTCGPKYGEIPLN